MVAPRVVPDLESIKSKILNLLDQSGGPASCWPWIGTRGKKGYGQIRCRYQRVLIHRAMYTLFVGPIASGLLVCHSCDNPPCGNPRHLWLGTQSQNLADAKKKGRLPHGPEHYSQAHPEKLARGEKSGSYLHPERISSGLRKYFKDHPEKIRNGVRIGTAKLTDDLVEEILRRHRDKRVTQKDLAREFNISQSTISCIIRRTYWKHISI